MAWTAFWRAAPDPRTLPPSSFATWVTERVDAALPLLDIGCGNGVDALHFAALGITTTGYDYANVALARGRRAAAKLGAQQPRFTCLSFGDTRATLGEGARLAGEPGAKSWYARLVLDALPPDGYENFWRLLRMAMARGGTAYLEFHAAQGSPLSGSRATLWKRVPSVPDVRRRITKAGGVVVEEASVPAGVASPRVKLHRVVAQWPLS